MTPYPLRADLALGHQHKTQSVIFSTQLRQLRNMDIDIQTGLAKNFENSLNRLQECCYNACLQRL